MLISDFEFRDPKDFSPKKRKLMEERSGTKVSRKSGLIINKGTGLAVTPVLSKSKDIFADIKVPPDVEGRRYGDKAEKYNSRVLNLAYNKTPDIKEQTRPAKPSAPKSNVPPSPVKKSLLNKRNLAIGGGLLAAGGTAYGLHKLNQERKSRNDKGKQRGKYRK